MNGFDKIRILFYFFFFFADSSYKTSIRLTECRFIALFGAFDKKTQENEADPRQMQSKIKH